LEFWLTEIGEALADGTANAVSNIINIVNIEADIMALVLFKMNPLAYGAKFYVFEPAEQIYNNCQ
jgi:hypothetical protein